MKRIFTLACMLVSIMSSFALTIEDGKVYTIANHNDNNVFVKDNGGNLAAANGKDANALWIFEDAGDGNYYVKNFTTGRYAQECATTSGADIALGETPVAYSIVDCSAQEGDDCFGFTTLNQSVTNFTANCIGWNWDNARVQTYAAVAGSNHKSFWKISEVATSVTLDKTEYQVGDPVVVTYINTPGGAKDWMAIYKSTDNPGGGTNSSTYRYVTGKSGHMTLNVEDAPNWEGAIGAGDYYVAYLLNDGYTEGLDRVAFVVKDPAVAGEEDITSCINNSDFELTEGMIVDGSNFRGIPTGWKAWGKRGETKYTQDPGVKDTEFLPGQSYGENGGCAATRHADKSYWLNPSTMPDDLKLYQEVALEAGNYRLTCLLSPMSQGDDQFTNLRLYAGDNASYFGSEDKYGENLGSETNKTFMGYSVDMDGGDPRMKLMTLEFTLAEAATIELGIRTGNMQKNGDRGNDNRGRFRCDYFTLTKIENLHVHDYSHNGICTCDGAAKYEEPALVGGYYLLDNAGKVEWFSHKVDLGGDNLQINGKLTADIDFTGITHMPIGQTTGKKYNGTFDGQGHRIMNMVINRPYDDNIGFFGFLRGNSAHTVIRNLIMDSSCSITARNRAGGFAGSCQNSGSSITIENCINEASVNVTGQDAAGFVGGHEDNSSSPKWIIRNCINTGTISTSHDDGYVGAFFCWSGNNNESKFENLINLGQIGTHKGGNIGRLAGEQNNIVDLSDTDDKTQGVVAELSADDIESGALAYYMNKVAGEDVFFQTIGTDSYPVPFSTSEVVKQVSVSEIGYSSYVVEAPVVFPADVEAYAVSSIEDGYVVLAAMTEAPQGEAVIVKGDEGKYCYNPVESATAPVANELKAATEEISVTEDYKFYALAQPEGKEVGFYPVAEGQTIPAGKAYLELATAGAKRFLALGGSPTDIKGYIIESNDGTREVYNLQGQKLSTIQRGINIVNGKKIIF